MCQGLSKQGSIMPQITWMIEQRAQEQNFTYRAFTYPLTLVCEV
jgi:hypothetical protein